MTKLTVDYAIPIYIGELSIGGSFFSIKRLTVSPHADFTFAGKDCLMSFGADAVLDLHSIDLGMASVHRCDMVLCSRTGTRKSIG